MQPFRLTLKNYRCFSDEASIRIEFRNGFTAFVGPNNSGKSTILKFFHELRDVWQKFPSDGIQTALHEAATGVNYQDIEDPEELFFNGNDRDLQFDIELLEAPQALDGITLVGGVTGTALRQSPRNWRLTLKTDRGRSIVDDQRRKPNLAGREGRQILNLGDRQYDITALLECMNQLQRSLYVPAFRNAINQGSGAYYGLQVGTSFIETWNRWKLGNRKQQARATEQVTEDICSIFEFDRLEINADAERKSLAVTINGQQYRLAELGSGLAQFIVIFGNAAIRQPPLILIDEPEINLHPSLQIAFLTALAKYSEGNVVFATHSIGLGRATAETIYSFQRVDDLPRVQYFEETPSYAEFVGEMSFSTYRELGCEAILLVEGVTDVKTYQQFLRRVKKDARVVTIPLGGDGMARGGVEHELDELTRLGAQLFAIVDSERTGPDAEPARRRVEFRESCERLGITAQLTDLRAIENYFTDEAVKAVLGDSYSALEPFESLTDHANGWNKRLHNWRIAQQMKRDDLARTDVGAFLETVLGAD